MSRVHNNEEEWLDEIEDDIYDEADEDDLLYDDYDESDMGEQYIPYAVYICEECDYRWKDVDIETSYGRRQGLTLEDMICPMCGSNNISKE